LGFAAAEGASDSKQKTKIVQASTIIYLVDPDTRLEQADYERDWRNEPMPKPSPETSRLRGRLLIPGVWPRDSKHIWHCHFLLCECGNFVMRS
jgi:hypothetical protein